MDEIILELNARIKTLERKVKGLQNRGEDLQRQHDKLDKIFNNAERFKELPPRDLWPLNYRIKAEPAKVNDWLSIYADKHHLKLEDLKGPCREAQIVTARHVAMWFLKINTPYSFKTIGGTFNRDHSTALHAHAKIERFLEIGDHLSKYSVDIANLTALEIWPVKD